METLEEFNESNRPYHRWIGFVAAFFGTIIGAAEVATAMEGKDCQHDKINDGLPPWKWNYRSWDWKDWWSTIWGGVFGQAAQIGVIYLILKLI